MFVSTLISSGVITASGKDAHESEWGRSTPFFQTGRLGAWLLRVKPGKIIKTHFHNQTEEVYYILEGTMKIVEADRRETLVRKGEVVFVTSKTPHSITTGDNEELSFFLVCTPPYDVKNLDVVYST
jgi:mannose-6-phosphate isomerase-like protein (cupin superfamily)